MTTLFQMRNVSAIHVHCSNQFSRAVSVFRSADISVSRDRRRYGSPVHFSYPVDRAVQAPRWVQIPLPNLVGTALRLQMFFDKRWILVSEVHIDSSESVWSPLCTIILVQSCLKGIDTKYSVHIFSLKYLN